MFANGPHYPTPPLRSLMINLYHKQFDGWNPKSQPVGSLLVVTQILHAFKGSMLEQGLWVHELQHGALQRARSTPNL